MTARVRDRQAGAPRRREQRLNLRDRAGERLVARRVVKSAKPPLRIQEVGLHVDEHERRVRCADPKRAPLAACALHGGIPVRGALEECGRHGRFPLGEAAHCICLAPGPRPMPQLPRERSGGERRCEGDPGLQHVRRWWGR